MIILNIGKLTKVGYYATKDNIITDNDKCKVKKSHTCLISIKQ